MRAAGAALACVLGVLAAAAAADAPLPEVAAALDRIKSASTVELATTGRKTGKEHKKPVWFVVEDGTSVNDNIAPGQTTGGSSPSIWPNRSLR